MKKIILVLICIISNTLFSQGALNIFNYTTYEMQGRLYARGKINCFPQVWTSYDFPAGLSGTTANYNASTLSPGWSVRTSANGTITNHASPGNSGFMTTMSALTKWQFTWFLLKDSNGVQTGEDFWMGDNAFSSPCGTPTNDIQVGPNSLVQAFWFTVADDTYILLQP